MTTPSVTPSASVQHRKPARSAWSPWQVGAAITAVLGVIAPIAYETFQTRTALEVQVLRAVTVSADSVGAEKLRFLYDTTLVASLTRLELALVNTGRTALRESDFAEPIAVTLDSGRLLDARITHTDPVGVTASIDVRPESRKVHIATSLLNSKDAVFVSVLTTATSPQVSTSGRIAGVRELAIRDLRVPLETRAKPRMTTADWIVGGAALFLFLMAAAGLHIESEARAVRRILRNGLSEWRQALRTPDGLALARNALREETVHTPLLRYALREDAADVLKADVLATRLDEALQSDARELSNGYAGVAVLFGLAVIGSAFLLNKWL